LIDLPGSEWGPVMDCKDHQFNHHVTAKDQLSGGHILQVNKRATTTWKATIGRRNG